MLIIRRNQSYFGFNVWSHHFKTVGGFVDLSIAKRRMVVSRTCKEITLAPNGERRVDTFSFGEDVANADSLS